MRYKHSTKLQHKEIEGEKETSPQLSFFFHLDSQYNIIKIENAMDININGDPGTGNTFTEIHVQHADNVNPNATALAIALENDGEHTVRGALGKDPLNGHIVSRLDRYMETFTLDRKNLPSKLDID